MQCVNAPSNVDHQCRDEDLDFPTLPEGLFPLQLTPLEYFFVVDDSAQQPMLATIQLNFRGLLDVAILQNAICQSIARNPLLSSRIALIDRIWHWVHDASWIPTIRSFEDAPPIVDMRLQSMDLTREPGLRVWHKVDGDETSLVFQIHHACADGIGIRRFIVDLLILYTRSMNISNTSKLPRLRLDRLSHERLSLRGCTKQIEQNPAAILLTSWQRTKNLVYFFLQPPHPLRPRTRMEFRHSSSSQDVIKQLILGKNESSEILERASKDHVKLNELGLALLFRTCKTWQQQQEANKVNRRIRLLTPYDLRGKTDLTMSAANRISFAFLGRTHRQCDDWHDLLQSVRSEMVCIKDSNVYADFLFGLRSGMKFPSIMRWAIRNSRNMATAVFSYGGDLDRRLNRNFTQDDGYTRIGDALLMEVMAAPPVRANTNIAIGLCLVNKHICMSAAWNRQVFTESEAADFLGSFAKGWRRWGRLGRPDGEAGEMRIANAA